MQLDNSFLFCFVKFHVARNHVQTLREGCHYTTESWPVFSFCCPALNHQLGPTYVQIKNIYSGRISVPWEANVSCLEKIQGETGVLLSPGDLSLIYGKLEPGVYKNSTPLVLFIFNGDSCLQFIFYSVFIQFVLAKFHCYPLDNDADFATQPSTTKSFCCRSAH